MIVSGICCAVSGLMFGAPPPLLFGFAIVWGVAVVADSAQLSALVAQYSPRDHVGTALTVQTCAGFLLTMASIRLLAGRGAGDRMAMGVSVPGARSDLRRRRAARARGSATLTGAPSTYQGETEGFALL